jgi:hypothetical protein
MAVTIDVVYDGDLECTLTHGPSGAQMKTDAPTDNRGRGLRFSRERPETAQREQEESRSIHVVLAGGGGYFASIRRSDRACSPSSRAPSGRSS